MEFSRKMKLITEPIRKSPKTIKLCGTLVYAQTKLAKEKVVEKVLSEKVE